MNRRAALAEASMQAQRLHARLHTDYNRPIDIFGVVQEMGIWLVSRPLGGGLFGFYLREGNAAGIVLNASHPEYLQRYTCAHELGHHILGHRSHLDERDDVMGDAPADRHDEHAAQMFAGSFLMPIQAVNRVQRRLGISRDHPPTPGQVYALSRELDVSFQAAAWQLVNLGRLSTAQAAEMVRVGSAATKRKLRPGPHPRADNRAGLAIIDHATRDVPVLLRPGDELRIRLPENAATGHLWQLNGNATNQPSAEGAVLTWDGSSGVATSDQRAEPLEQLDGAPVVLVAETYTDSHASRADGPHSGDREPMDRALGTVAGEREFVFIADQPGRHELVISLRRPWEDDIEDEVATIVRVGPRHVLDGIAEGQIRGHVARVASGGQR